ncbi:unnamed protein product [Cuscuta campestris]|uniref:Uncharacterized protein n=2 Tax=Cuscuta sect. Cleistogrammica TaxID=1824901 RepID=A0A484M0F7_9ASTE|nr:hypothetical protein DM860_001368 [Cuscuta australis]VFQ81987.1 unnamed protein product [Cuscuta campestris]
MRSATTTRPLRRQEIPSLFRPDTAATMVYRGDDDRVTVTNGVTSSPSGDESSGDGEGRRREANRRRRIPPVTSPIQRPSFRRFQQFRRRSLSRRNSGEVWAAPAIPSDLRRLPAAARVDAGPGQEKWSSGLNLGSGGIDWAMTG